MLCQDALIAVKVQEPYHTTYLFSWFRHALACNDDRPAEHLLPDRQAVVNL